MRLTIKPQWRGSITKRTAELRFMTIARLCQELGLEKPAIRIAAKTRKHHD